MENYSVVIFIMAVMIAFSALADKIRLPYPVLLIAVGIAIGFIPTLPQIEISTDVIFLIFLPPLLYDAAFNISFKEFRTQFNTIGTLAVGLVFLTTVCIAVVARYCIPGIDWPLAFVLGSILSATDAVAAISVTKGLNISHKTTTILEGESLVNDASSLTAYQFAVAAVAGTSFVFWKAWLQFMLVIFGGIAIGMIISRILGFVLKRVQNNSLVTISFMLLMPFVTYLIAEELKVSGVIAVVMLGLGISRFSTIIFPDKLKQQSKNFWEIIIFLLNGLIFVIIGLEFPYVLKQFGTDQLLNNICYAFIIFLITLLVRFLRVFLQRVSLQSAFKKGRRKITQEMLLEIPSSIIISLAGMRGIVSLATAIGLPLIMVNGKEFPMRDTIIFIAIVVVLFTLVIQGLLLPLIAKRFIKTSDEIAAS